MAAAAVKTLPWWKRQSRGVYGLLLSLIGHKCVFSMVNTRIDRTDFASCRGQHIKRSLHSLVLNAAEREATETRIAAAPAKDRDDLQSRQDWAERSYYSAVAKYGDIVQSVESTYHAKTRPWKACEIAIEMLSRRTDDQVKSEEQLKLWLLGIEADRAVIRLLSPIYGLNMAMINEPVPPLLAN